MADHPRALRVGVSQFNPVVGDLEGNTAKALAVVGEANDAGADVVILPELALTGYPPEDLVLKSGFIADARAALEKFAAGVGATPAIIGFAAAGRCEAEAFAPADADLRSSVRARNAAAVCRAGKVLGVYHKRHLPNYDVFDELRHFIPGERTPELFEIAGVPVGITLCEDSWVGDGPVAQLARLGARLVLNINGSPFRSGKQRIREQVICARVDETGVPIVYTNLVGGQDELVFDGGSFVVSPSVGGAYVSVRCESFTESLDVFDVDLPEPSAVHDSARCRFVTPARPERPERLAGPMSAALDPLSQEWHALVLGVRDYVEKSGYRQVCVGLSGGVDSSMVAAVAVDALGADNVCGVLMPSRHSSDHSIADAEQLARNLGFATRVVPIEPAHAALGDMLSPHMRAKKIATGDLTDQNLQSRVRGVVLMALANEHGLLVLTTGNKSETAVGYSTLFGDTAGAFAVIKDVWKLRVYELCAWRNARAPGPWIPEAVLTKDPSAELAPGQRDDQSLPPYTVLDPILRAYVEQDLGVAEILRLDIDGADPEMIRRTCRLVDRAEYKRRQSPLGPRITGKAFGRDRRMPIVNRYRG